MSATSEALFEQIQQLTAKIEAAEAVGADPAQLKTQLSAIREQHTRAQRVLTEDRKALLRD
jgi:hypothetical protein